MCSRYCGLLFLGPKWIENCVLTSRQYCITVIRVVIRPDSIPNTKQDLLITIIQLTSNMLHTAGPHNKPQWGESSVGARRGEREQMCVMCVVN